MDQSGGDGAVCVGGGSWPPRHARDADAQDLFGLLAICFADYPGCFVDPHDDLADLRQPGRSFGGPDEGFWVVEDTFGRIAACVAMDRPEHETAELHRLYVRPDFRGDGLGGRLIEFVAREASLRGARSLRLWSDTRFGAAHRLYRRLGFRELSEMRDLGDISRSREQLFERSLEAGAQPLAGVAAAGTAATATGA